MNKTIKKILITGGTGFVGTHLIDRLSHKYEIVCITRDASCQRKGIKIIYGDIADAKCIKEAMSNIYAVVHLASVFNPSDDDIVKINVRSTKLLADAAKISGVKKFIFISTENVLHNFDDAYSTTKRIAEKLIKSFKNHLILRPAAIYGENDERYVKNVIGVAGKYKMFPIPGNGKNLFQPVYVDDVVTCIENGLKYDVFGEYVVAGPSKITYNEFVNAILKEFRINATLIHVPLDMLKMVNHLNSILKIHKIRFYQAKSLEMDKIYDIKKTTRALRYTPTTLSRGLRKTHEAFIKLHMLRRL